MINEKRIFNLAFYVDTTVNHVLFGATFRYAKDPTMKFMTMSVVENFCEFLQGRRKQTFLIIIFSTIRNLLDSFRCPIQVSIIFSHFVILLTRDVINLWHFRVKWE